MVFSMRISLKNLTKSFGDVTAVKNLNLEIEDGEFVALLGPSGCGKTTVLLMIAGIYKPTAGVIEFDGRVVNRVPPKERNVGMVFQSYALYPHMNVFQNLAFPLVLKKVPSDTIKKEVHRIAEMLGLENLLYRKPAELSGGQQQRVALGRALIKKPDVLLFDEPLSNLDARLRISMRSEIRKIQKELGITSIYVTHDQMEAMTMADRIAVLKDGVLQAYADPASLYEHPPNLFVASFIGSPPMNILDACVDVRGGRYFINICGNLIDIPKFKIGSPPRNIKLGVRPEDISPSDEGVPAEVYFVELLGREFLVTCAIKGCGVKVSFLTGLTFKPGDIVKLNFDVEKIHIFDPGTGKALV